MNNAASPRVAFVCAMPIELEPLVRMLSLDETEVDGESFHTGTLDGRPVVAVVTGMGTELATAGMTRLFARFDLAWVLVVGITGALKSETPIGTLVLPEIVKNSETGATFRPTVIGNAVHRGTMWTTNGLTTDTDKL